MGFFNPLTTIENEHKWDRPYKGTVVVVDDTKQIGRIKVSIPELFGEYTKEGDKDSSGIFCRLYREVKQVVLHLLFNVYIRYSPLLSEAVLPKNNFLQSRR